MPGQSDRWNDASDVIPMFPTLVWKVELSAQLRETIDTNVFRSAGAYATGFAIHTPGKG